MNVFRAIHRKLGIKYRFDRCRRYVARFGVRGALRTHRRIWSHRGSRLDEVLVPGVPHPVTIRPGTADASTLEKIFVWNEYELDYPDDVRTIVDAGANVGLSAIFFANRFPAARIVAIEPERANHDLLSRNTASYPNVTAIRAALWGEDATLTLSNPADRVDSYSFAPGAGDQAVEALSIPTILTRFGIPTIDVLKVDIEGGETSVFESSAPWIARVRMFVVELHGPRAIEAFRTATDPLDAIRYRRGESEIVLVR